MMISKTLGYQSFKTIIKLGFVLVFLTQSSSPIHAEPREIEPFISDLRKDYFGDTGQPESTTGSGTYCIENPDLTIHPCWENQTDENSNEAPENQTDKNFDRNRNLERDERRSCNRSMGGSR